MNFFSIPSEIKSHMYELGYVKPGNELDSSLTNDCFQNIKITVFVDGEFTKMTFSVTNPNRLCKSSFVLESSYSFYVVPLNFIEELTLTIAYQPDYEIKEVGDVGFHVLFLDDNSLVSSLSKYWVKT